ncbi:MAG TPA: hypothetical protein VFG87_00065 [Amycolatopsis sp.]|nr:hypothetical protein [Amycolatopsis sp.]
MPGRHEADGLPATYIHGACIAQAAGTPWSSVTFVPSAGRPGANHPIVELARSVYGNNHRDSRVVLNSGPGITDTQRRVREDRFELPRHFRHRIADGHVLIVEDTWVSGAKLQSAAIALKLAGAATVTALCVARWCDSRMPEHRNLLDAHESPYNAILCPVTGGTCPGD